MPVDDEEIPGQSMNAAKIAIFRPVRREQEHVHDELR